MVDLQRSRPGEGGGGLLVRAALVLLVVVGAVLRTAWTGDQIVAGDEIHPLLQAARHGPLRVLGTFGENDHCIPITLWCKLLQATVGLEEWGLRLPAFLPGSLLVAVVAWLSRGRLGRGRLGRGCIGNGCIGNGCIGNGERVLLTLVVATSPLLVYWSRVGRPYSAIALLSVLAVAALVRFGLRGERRFALACTVCLGLVLHLSPTALPFVVGLTAGAAIWGGGGARRSPGRLALPGLLGLALGAVLLAPALPSLLEVAGGKRAAPERVGLETVLDTLRLVAGLPVLEAGDPRRLAVLLPALLGAFGLARLAVAHARVAVAVAVALFLPAAAYALAPVTGISNPHVYARYQAALVPFFLALPVYGLAELRVVVGRRGAAALVVLAAAGVLALAALGPLAGGLPPRQPFGFQCSRMNAVRLPAERTRAECVSDFYRGIASGAEPAVLVEWPAREPNRHLLADLHSVHGARVVRCWPLGEEPQGFAFRTILFGFVSAARRAPEGAYVVLHKAPDRELERVETCGGRPPSREVFQAGAACRQIFGAPAYEDDWIVVFRR